MSPRDALLRYPLFAALGAPFVEVWAGMAEPLTVQTGQTLFQAGSRGDHAYLVRSGRVRVLKIKEEREVSLGAFAAGDVFGDYALLTPYKNTATCRACEPGQLLRLPLAPVRAALGRMPAISVNLKNWLRLHALVGYLRGGSFLGFLSATSVLPLLDRCAELTFPAGHTIQADGLSVDRWFYIRTGSVEADETTGHRILNAGDTFGERGLIGKGGVPVRATARGDVLALGLNSLMFSTPLSGTSISLNQSVLAAREQRQYDWLAQRDANDCGPASLTMAARGLGLDTTLEHVRALVKLGPAGSNLQDLAQTAGRLGLRATAVRIAATQLASVRLPAVAHLANGHYIALFELRLDGLVAGDPASGVRTLAFPAFQQAWSGNLLLLARADA